MEVNNDGIKEDPQAASTSKKEPKDRTAHDDDEELDRDDRSYSESTGSEYTGRSRTMARKEIRPLPPKLPKRENMKLKRRVRRGRVIKRRQTLAKRYPAVRRAPKRKPRNDKRDRDSLSTIFTKMSSVSGSDTQSCTYCGHRCCGRRSCRKRQDRFLRRLHVMKITKQLRKQRRMEIGRKRKPDRVFKKSRQSARRKRSYRTSNGSFNMSDHPLVTAEEAIQAGSVSKILSPLFVKTNATLDEDPKIPGSFAPITPDMIVETIKTLAGWQQMISEDRILQHLKKTYPVNHNEQELLDELQEKLRIAVVSGILLETSRDNVRLYCLSYELKNRKITKNHVSIFWKLYADTMSPVNRKNIPPNETFPGENVNQERGALVQLAPVKEERDYKGYSMTTRYSDNTPVQNNNNIVEQVLTLMPVESRIPSKQTQDPAAYGTLKRQSKRRKHVKNVGADPMSKSK